MDNEFVKKLILIGVVAAVVVALYYIMSPYQNCVRSGYSEWQCTKMTSW